MYKLTLYTIKRLEDGIEFPLVDGNSDYEKYKEWLKIEGNIPEPEFTADEIAANKLEKEKALKSKNRADAMLAGAEYQDYKISFTKEDGDGVVQVKNAFEMGLTKTIIYFQNGTKFPINASDFSDFASWFVMKRDTFFSEDNA